LLRDAGNDPIKRAGVIHDVVESIALIPDAIKASVFVRECSVLLDIEERLLIAELNKLRIGRAKKADGKRESSPTQSTENVTAERSGAQETSRVEAVSSDVLHEREIVRILLHYGNQPATWEEDDVPVAPLLLSGVSDVAFAGPACGAVRNIYRGRLSRGELPDAGTFIAPRDRIIADLAIDLLATTCSVSPTRNDEKRKIYVSHESERWEALLYGAI